MRGAFSEFFRSKIEKNSILKKSFIRVFTLCLSVGLIFSAISYSIIHSAYSKTENVMLIHFIVLMLVSTMIGGLCGGLVFGNILTHIKKIVQELSNDKPRWEFLEEEYMESDIHSAYMAIKKLHSAVFSQSKLICLAEITAQVAHDIRSPLVVLDFLLQDFSDMTEEKRILLRNAINQINNIANNVLMQHKSNKNETTHGLTKKKEEPKPIIELVLDIIDEKKFQYKKLLINFISEIDDAIYCQFAKVNDSEFKRVLSNLIDNSVEAVSSKEHRVIKVIGSSVDENISLAIHDNGCGMSNNIIQKIINGESVSHKENGNGLGLAYAIKLIEKEWGGKILIESTVDKGTKIEIILKNSEPPFWFVSKLDLTGISNVVILDDNQDIHHVWKTRFSEKTNNILLKSLYNYDDLISYHHEDHKLDTLYLIDFEFSGFKRTGIDLINQLDINSKSYLVTSKFDDKFVQNKCHTFGIKIIPKKLSVKIPLEEKVDLIFIDDNQSIIKTWILHGEIVGKKVDAFNDIASFKLKMPHYDKSTPIYIDSDLNNDQTGEEFSKELFEYGFKNIYLSTCYGADHFNQMPWIKAILGKEPSF